MSRLSWSYLLLLSWFFAGGSGPAVWSRPKGKSVSAQVG